LVEGGYIATCRHVWRIATEAAAKIESNIPLQVEVEYPRSRQDDGTERRRAGLVDACNVSGGLPPDLVLLLPDTIPTSGVRVLPLASHERFEVGDGYAITARVEDNPNSPRDVKIKGSIADHQDTNGRREFTGSNASGYWFHRGSSGSPVFVQGGEQVAGIVSLSELDANESRIRLQEAFIVPGTTIRSYLVKLKATPVAHGQQLGIAELQPVLEVLGLQDMPLPDVPARLKDFIIGARARAAEEVRPSDDRPDIEATIAAARAKLGQLDAAGAHAVLGAKIAELEEILRQRLIPLLGERAAIQQLSFDHSGAKATLGQMLALDRDRVSDWITLARLEQRTGSLSQAAVAAQAALDAARRTDNPQDEGGSLNEIGDVLVAGGNLLEALKAFRDGLAIADRLAKADPGNAKRQRELSVSYDRVGDVLWARGELSKALKSYRAGLVIAERLAKADPDNAGWQRDLSISYNKIGDVLVDRGELPKALKSYREGFGIADRLTKVDPTNADWQHDLSASYVKIGDVYKAQENWPEALTSYRTGLVIVERLAKADLGNVGWQRDLSVSYNKIGDVLADQGDLADALKSFCDALAVRDRLVKADPGNAGWRRDLSVSYDRVGEVLVRQVNLPEALKSFREGLAIRQSLVMLDAGHAGWQRDLSVSFDNVGDVLKAQGKQSQALKSFRDGFAIADHLAKTDPENAGWQHDLAAAHWKLAINGDDAATRFVAIVEILRKLDLKNELAPKQGELLTMAKNELAKLQRPG
jgi:tetratricopeptide (TPR) repeat protein